MSSYSDYDPGRYVTTTASQKPTYPDIYNGVSMIQDNCPGVYGGVTSLGIGNINNDSHLTSAQKEDTIKELEYKAMMYY